METSSLFSPVYLDTGLVLDLLATAEDGFSMVEQVSTRYSEGSSTQKHVEGSGGASGVLSGLLRLDLNLGASKAIERGQEHSAQAERTHTHGSLFARLRRYLRDTQQLISLDEGVPDELPLGSFVEASGILHPNPFSGVLQQIKRSIEFPGMASQLSSAQPLEGSKSQRAQAQAIAAAQRKQLEEIVSLLDSLSSDVERPDVRLVTLKRDSSELTVLASIVTELLLGRSIEELAGRSFRLVGTTVRPSADIEIDILQSSGIGGLGQETLDALLDGIASLRNAGLQFGVPSAKLEPPVVEVLPIALFV